MKSFLKKYRTFIIFVSIYIGLATLFHLIIIWIFNPSNFQANSLFIKDWDTYSNKALGISIRHPRNAAISESRNEVTFSLGINQELTIGRGIVTREMLQGSPDGVNKKVNISPIRINNLEAFGSRVDNWTHEGFSGHRISPYADINRTLYIFENQTNSYIFHVRVNSFLDHNTWGILNTMIGTFQKI